MPIPSWTDQSGATPGTALSAANMTSMTAADTTEAATNDTLGGSSTYVNNLNRIRYQIGQLVGGAWTAAVQMIPLSARGAASGVVPTSAAPAVISGAFGGTPTISNQASGSTVTLQSGATNTRGAIQVAIAAGGPALATGERACTLSFSATLAATPVVVVGNNAPGNVDPAWGIANKTTSGFDLIWQGPSTTNYTTLAEYIVLV